MNELPLPDGFLDSVRCILGNETAAFTASYQQAPYRGIRFRDARRPLPAEELGAPIPYAPNAYYLSAASQAGNHPLHEAGAYYLQEPSAMAAVAVLAPQSGDRLLDLCAAPGGKSTQLAASAPLSLLVANEPVTSRAQILARNIERMGIGNAVVTCAYPETLAARWPLFFDKILVDAPCSGEGMFRRHPETRMEWTVSSPARCAERQLTILKSAAQMLRVGGTMVYSTCTFSGEENEGVIDAFLRDAPDFSLRPIVCDGLPASASGMLRLWPHRFSGEGHFIALLQKNGDMPRADSTPLFSLPAPEHDWTAAFQAFAWDVGLAPSVAANAVWNGRLLSVPSPLPPLQGVRVLRIGLPLGALRGRVMIPEHSLALATPMQKRYVLDDAQARAYQHGETLPVAEQMRGFYALTYRGYQLGFGKASDGCMKNHYPKGLRK